MILVRSILIELMQDRLSLGAHWPQKLLFQMDRWLAVFRLELLAYNFSETCHGDPFLKDLPPVRYGLSLPFLRGFLIALQRSLQRLDDLP